jgi:integrase
MSALAQRSVESDVLLRDLRHMDARAAGDLADWLVHLELEGKADRTLYGYTRYIAGLLRTYPDTAIDGFTHTDLNEFLRLTPRDSRHIVRSVLNGFFDWARLDDRIDKNPVDRVPKMRNPKRRQKDIFSEVEIELLESLPPPDGQLWTLLFGSGLRRGEARRLRWGHISLEDFARAWLAMLPAAGHHNRADSPATAAVRRALERKAAA